MQPSLPIYIFAYIDNLKLNQRMRKKPEQSDEIKMRMFVHQIFTIEQWLQLLYSLSSPYLPKSGLYQIPTNNFLSQTGLMCLNEAGLAVWTLWLQGCDSRGMSRANPLLASRHYLSHAITHTHTLISIRPT